MSGAFALPQNSTNPSERGSANFDVRFRAANYFVWDLPLFRTRSFGGWQIAGVYTLQSGQPFTVNSIVDSNQDGNLTDRLNGTAGLQEGDGRTSLELTVPVLSLLAPVGQDGVVGRNTFRANGLHNLDMAIAKNMRRADGPAMQLRFEVFNALNRTHFGMPVRLLEFPSFGQSVKTGISPRTLQFGAKFEF